MLRERVTSPPKPESKRPGGERSNAVAISQKSLCAYLNEEPSNVSARARRRGLSAEDYLKAVAQERKNEVWQRQPGGSGWIKIE